MINYYEVLGLKSSATQQEIRRAYRILARRYHPDLNPGKSSEDRFKQIASAYEVLSDTEKRKTFDTELETNSRIRAGFDAYRRAQQRHGSTTPRGPRPTRTQPPPRHTATKAQEPEPSLFAKLSNIKSIISSEFRSHAKQKQKPTATKEETSNRRVDSIALLEVSVSLSEAINGLRKSIEVGENQTRRKYSVSIPAGIKNGSLIRMKSSKDPNEELVIVVRVAQHPFISIQSKGLVVEIPIAVTEAIEGASISVPTLEGHEKLTIPPGTQTGTEFRLSGKGIKLADGNRGDLFFRVLVHIPTCHQAVGIQDKARELSAYYEGPVRQSIPATLAEWF